MWIYYTGFTLSVWSPKHIYILVKRGTNFDFRADLHWDRPWVGQVYLPHIPECGGDIIPIFTNTRTT